MNIAIQVLKSSAIMFGLKLFQRSLGLISLIVLARVLSQEEFAIVAIATLVIFFFDTIGNTGTENYIIQKSKIDDFDIGTAWVLDIILKSILSLSIFLLSTSISDFFRMPELSLVLQCSCFIILLNAAKNPKLYICKRELDYKYVFIISVIQKIVSFIVLMSIVFYRPSYWAMVIADIVGSFVQFILSWLILGGRVKITLIKLREQWSFSCWVLLRSVIGYSKAQLDAFFVGRFFNATDVGLYNVTRNLSIMPSTDIISPAIEPMLSAFSKNKEDKEKSNLKFKIALLAATLFTTPIAGYMYFYPEPIINILLGSKWDKAVFILPPLTIAMTTIVFNTLINQLFIANGLVKQLFYFEVVSLIATFTLLYFCKDMDLNSFTSARVYLLVAFTVILTLLLRVYFDIGTLYILNITAPLIFCAAASGIICTNIINVNEQNSLIELIITGPIFFAIFICLTYTSYRIFYKRTPEGTYIAELLMRLIRQLRERILSR